jgi:hypothetical protein
MAGLPRFTVTAVRSTAMAGAGGDGNPQPAGPRSPSALPSVGSRLLAFALILLAGAAGGFIGYSFIDLQCEGDCTVQTGLGALVGSVLAAGGVAVVTVLTLRAMGEWRTIQHREASRPENRPPRVQ